MTPDVLDLVQESVVLRDRDGRITRWNAASERLYGWHRAEAMGRTIHELLKTRREAVPSIETALAENGVWEGDVTRRTASGVLITVRLQCVARGEAEIVETAIDVSAQRHAEDALKRAEHRYYNVFQAMAVSFWELDFTPVGAMVRRLLRSGTTDLSRYFTEHPEIVREMIRATHVIDVNDQSVQLRSRRQTGNARWPRTVLATGEPARLRGKCGSGSRRQTALRERDKAFLDRWARIRRVVHGLFSARDASAWQASHRHHRYLRG